MMPKIVGSGVAVVEAPGLKIEELAGNVASKDDRISIAYVDAKAGTEEPWLTLHYDEWICVRKGSIRFHYTPDPALKDKVSEVVAKAGQTIFIPTGTRFNPQFPEDTEYIPICLPAFRPDRCIREDAEDAEGIAKKLRVLHEAGTDTTDKTEPVPEILYHMCPKAQWEAAKKSGEAYYPDTYVADGYYTHATGVPSRLIDTANHFYTDSKDSNGIPLEWVCLEFTRTSLKKIGIHVRDEAAMPVGNKETSSTWTSWICPHVIGGIPVIDGIVQKERPMTRKPDGTFVSIEGI